MSKLLVLLTICFLQITSIAAPVIYGGRDVTLADPASKFSVAVEFTPGGYCSGTLIGPNLVLTATHCYQEPAHVQNPTKIFFGLDVRNPVAVRNVIAIESHPGYQQRWPQPSDLAIVKFEGDLPAGFAPVTINDSVEITKKITAATVSGYGKQKAAAGQLGDEFFGKLKQVDLKRGGAVAFSPKGTIVFDQTVDTGGACNGDSGGSTFIEKDGQLILVGVNNSISNAFSANCTGKFYVCDLSFPENITWIKNTLKSL